MYPKIRHNFFEPKKSLKNQFSWLVLWKTGLIMVVTRKWCEETRPRSLPSRPLRNSYAQTLGAGVISSVGGALPKMLRSSQSPYRGMLPQTVAPRVSRRGPRTRFFNTDARPTGCGAAAGPQSEYAACDHPTRRHSNNTYVRVLSGGSVTNTNSVQYYEEENFAFGRYCLLLRNLIWENSETSVWLYHDNITKKKIFHEVFLLSNFSFSCSIIFVCINCYW